MATKDYYDVLEVPQNATQDVIKKQYRFLLHAWHPDKFPDPDQKARANQKTKEINEAYDVLGDPIKRAPYDRQHVGHQEASQANTAQASSPLRQQSSTSAKSTQPPRHETSDEQRQRRFEEAQRYQAEQRQRQQAETMRHADQEQHQGKNIMIALAIAVVAFIVLFIGTNGSLTSLFSSGGNQPTPVAASFNPTSTIAETLVSSSATLSSLPPTIVPEPTQTATPPKPQLLEQESNYKIELIPSQNRTAQIIVQTPEPLDLSQQGFMLLPVIKDITGHWQVNNDEYPTNTSFDPSQGFIADSHQISGGWTGPTPGDYLLVQDSNGGLAELLGGYWGDGAYDTREGIVFPIKDGFITRITIILSELKVGVVNHNGTSALPGIGVEAFCQATDIAGTPTYDSKCAWTGGAPDYGVYTRTDATGQAIFFLGPGTYFLQISDTSGDTIYAQTNVQLAPGQEKQLIAKVQQDG